MPDTLSPTERSERMARVRGNWPKNGYPTKLTSGRSYILAQPKIDRVPQKAVTSPGQIRDFGHSTEPPWQCKHCNSITHSGQSDSRCVLRGKLSGNNPRARLFNPIGRIIEGRTMNMHWITSSAAAVTIATFISAAPTHAAVTPRIHTGASILQHVDCAVGFHLGPAGACILGTEEEHHDVVIEKRGADVDCSTKTVKKTNGEGDSVTKTTSNCD